MVFVKQADYEDTRNATHRRKGKKCIYKDRTSIGLPDDVIDLAEQISEQFRIKGNRDNRLVRRQFVCLYYACLAIKKREPWRDITCNPEKIAKYVGLAKEYTSKALTDFSPYKTGYTPEVITDTGFERRPCVEIAFDIGKDVGIPENGLSVLEEMIETAFRIKGKELVSRTAPTIAISAIMAYEKIFSAGLDLEKLSSSISQMTTQSVCEIIIEAFNS
jgi:hypothetical protein